MVLLKSLLLIIDFFIFYTIISEVVVEYKKQKRGKRIKGIFR